MTLFSVTSKNKSDRDDDVVFFLLQAKAVEMSEVGLFKRLSGEGSNNTDTRENDGIIAVGESSATREHAGSRAGDSESASAVDASEADSHVEREACPKNSAGRHGVESSCSDESSVVTSTSCDDNGGADSFPDTADGRAAKTPASVSRNLFDTFLSDESGSKDKNSASEDGGCRSSSEKRRQSSESVAAMDVDCDSVKQELDCEVGDKPSESDIQRKGEEKETDDQSNVKSANPDKTDDVKLEGSSTREEGKDSHSSDMEMESASHSSAREEEKDGGARERMAEEENEASVERKSDTAASASTPSHSASTTLSTQANLDDEDEERGGGGVSGEGIRSVSAIGKGDKTGSKGEKHVTLRTLETSHSQSQALVSHTGRPFPRDFNTVRMKVEAGKYQTVVCETFFSSVFLF